MILNPAILQLLGLVFLIVSFAVLVLRTVFMIIKKHRLLVLDMILTIVFAITALIGFAIKKTLYIDSMIIGSIIYFVSNIVMKKIYGGNHNGKKIS